jgi:hypothetical protein
LRRFGLNEAHCIALFASVSAKPVSEALVLSLRLYIRISFCILHFPVVLYGGRFTGVFGYGNEKEGMNELLYRTALDEKFSILFP